MKKSAVVLILAMILTTTIAANLTTPVFARHSRKVYWVTPPYAVDTASGVAFNYSGYENAALAPSAAEMYGTPHGKPIAFAVENTGRKEIDDNIVAVEVIINQTKEGFAQFKLERGLVTPDITTGLEDIKKAENWGTRIVETDGKGWVRVFRFELTDPMYEGYGIQPEQTLYFILFFSQGKDECTYEFTVWTHDFGLEGPQESKSHPLWLIMDPHPPMIHEFKPADGSTVNGLPLPCGRHYFSVNVMVTDYPECDSRIENTPYTLTLIHNETGTVVWRNIFVDAVGTIRNVTGPNYRMYYFRNNDTWIVSHMYIQSDETTPVPVGDTLATFPEGYYRLTLTVKDRVGNAATQTHMIYYVPPPIPMFTASPETWIKTPLTGLVESRQVTHVGYKTKTLGSSVTITDSGFKPNTAVAIRIYIRTYEWYNATYGTFNVLVNSTTAKADGTVTGTFIFPKAPQGTYTILIIGQDPAGTPLTKYKTVMVVAQMIFNPDDIIGPAVINVMATGFLRPHTEAPVGTTYLLIREDSWEHPKDAIMGINQHVPWNWYIDFNGTLQNWATRLTGVKVAPGFTMPIMQPGIYHITLLISTPCYYWQCELPWLSRSLMSHSNTIRVTDWTGDILDAAQGAKTAAEGAKTSADAAKTSADAAKTSADGAKTSADAAKSSADGAKTSADTAGTNANAAKTSADAAKTAAEGVQTAADSAKAAAEGLTMPVYLAVILSLIAAIAAAICTILVYRKIA